jgi:hypothetical protein
MTGAAAAAGDADAEAGHGEERRDPPDAHTVKVCAVDLLRS